LNKIDINCDLAEVLIRSGENIDHKLMPYISSCNISTGAHAGDRETTESAIKNALKHNVAIGAHPSYPDREYFGRRSMNMDLIALRDTIYKQITQFIDLAKSQGAEVHHVKPHGALYNDIILDRKKAELLISTIKDIDPQLQLYGLAQSNIAKLAEQEGIQFIHEVFADRAYEGRDQLRSRRLEGAVLEDPEYIKSQIASLVHNGLVTLYGGERVPLHADTICVHSDTKNSEDILVCIFNYLKQENIDVSST